MDYHYLLYVLERVKGLHAAHGKFGWFPTFSGDEEHEACKILARDGLIHGNLVETDEETGVEHWHWQYG